MIPERSGYTVDSTLKGTDVRMGIAADATQHLMGILTELYEDPELACIREYATNARDAHVEAGVAGRPIEVATPTDLRPALVIRDYGVGLDLEDVRAIYSQYGASTKRSSNDAVGMLGLGCKSALAYSDAFTLRAIKNGKVALVSVARDEKGAGVMTVLEQGDTDDEDGVEVTIPAGRSNEIAEKARRFFSFWEPGTVLLNGEAPEPISGYELTPELLVIDGDVDYGRNGRAGYVVMGNVPYPAHFDVELPYAKRLVARVPIGAVQFTPSREGLMDTPVTKHALAEIAERFKAAKRAAVQRDVDTATSRGEAMAKLAAASTALGGNPRVTWNGEDVPHEIALAGAAGNIRHVPVLRSYRPHNQSSSIRAANAKLAGSATWIVNFTNAHWTKTNRAKLLRYVEAELGESDGAERDYLLVNGPTVPMAQWLSEVTVIDWQNVRSWKDPEAPARSGGGGGQKYAGTYPVWYVTASGSSNFTKMHAAADLAKLDKGKLYHREASPGTSGREFEALRELHGDGVILVELTSTRREKYLRTFPESQQVGDVLAVAAKKWWAGLSEDERAACDGRLRYHDELAELVEKNIEDPELRRLVKLAKIAPRVYADFNQRARYLPAKPSGAVDKIVNRYPLMPGSSYITRRERAHTELYVNAVYAAQTKGK